METQTKNTVYLSLGVLVLATFLALLAGRSLANPISRLTAAASKLAVGDLTVQAKVESKDEIGELAATLYEL